MSPLTITKPEIFGRNEWNAIDIPPQSYRKYPDIKFYNTIVIHHSAGPTARSSKDELKMVKRIQEEHLKLGWADIGYHYLVGDFGIYSGRNIEYVGAHTEGANYGKLGICILGNYENIIPTNYSLKFLQQLINWYGVFLGIAPDMIKGHKDFNATACPGKNLYKVLPTIRKIYKEVYKQNIK